MASTANNNYKSGKQNNVSQENRIKVNQNQKSNPLVKSLKENTYRLVEQATLNSPASPDAIIEDF